MTAENRACYRILSRRKLKIDSHSVIIFRRIFEIDIAAYSASVHNAERRTERNTAAEYQLILADALTQKIHGLTHDLTS